MQYQNNIRTLKTITIITTVLNSILAFIYLAVIVCSLFLVITFDSGMAQIKNKFEAAPSHELTGGYEIVGLLFGGMTVVAIYLVCLVLIAVCVILFLFRLAILISGIVALVRDKNKEAVTQKRLTPYKINSILSIILNSIIVLHILSFVFTSGDFILLLAVFPSFTLLALGIATLVIVSSTKSLLVF